MLVKVKRGIFLAIIICACLVSVAWDNTSAVQVSMLMVLCPTFGYWILRLFVPAFREIDEASMYVCNLSCAERVEAGITAVCMIMLIIIWGIKSFA